MVLSPIMIGVCLALASFQTFIVDYYSTLYANYLVFMQMYYVSALMGTDFAGLLVIRTDLPLRFANL